MEGGKLCKSGSWHPHEILVVFLKTEMLWKFCCFDAFVTFPMILHRWISVGSDLKFDARRDLDDVGATCIEGIFMENFTDKVVFITSPIKLNT